MATNEKEIINKFLNVFWKWIKAWDAPAQSDSLAWEALDNSAHKVLQEFEKQYAVNESLHLMFVRMLNDYQEYCGKVNK